MAKSIYCVMFVICLNLCIMYQLYGGSNLILMRSEVTGSKMKWDETGGYQFMRYRFNLNASMSGI